MGILTERKVIKEQWQSNTLFCRFIEEKYAAYREPKRKGTPKGDPIGLSKKKYLAALMMLLDLPLKSIAGFAGISIER